MDGLLFFIFVSGDLVFWLSGIGLLSNSAGLPELNIGDVVVCDSIKFLSCLNSVLVIFFDQSVKG